MRFASAIARAFAMTDEVWARHANPWSVWTRVASLPLLLAAVWSHSRLGWMAAVPVGLVVVWLWLNPRLFPPPRTTSSWASRATFGERVWLARDRVPIPGHHARAACLLASASGVAFVAAMTGAVLNDLALTAGAGGLSWVFKMWFVDRMVWLYDDMRDKDPLYRSWLR